MITVQPGASIQTAINSAPEGAVICLPEGEWTEYVTIEKSITLRGAGANKTTIRGKSLDGPVVRVRKPADMVEIQDLTLTGAQGGKYGFGLIVLDTPVVRVSRCVVSANAIHGVVLLGSSQGIISDSTIRDNPKNGVVIYDNAHALIIDSEVSRNGWSGVTVEKDAEADIASCTILGNGTGTGGADMGIVVVGNARATITACTISDNLQSGIAVVNTSAATITACTILRNVIGVWLDGSGQATIAGCDISGSRRSATGTAGDGIQLEESSRATIRDCSLSENERNGITLKDAPVAVVEGNDIFLNGNYGVALYERPCFDKDGVFTGSVTGGRNTIPGPGEADGNQAGAGCPSALGFLMTEEGGELNRQATP
jgi:parallel beta-helix repeat protein